MSIIEKIKDFFNRNKIKALPSGNELQKRPTTDVMDLYTQETKIYSAREALKQNWVLGQREISTRDSIAEISDKRNKALEALIDSEFEYDSPLQKTCITLDQSAYISDIIKSYLKAKIGSNKLDYTNVSIEPEEIISLIGYLEDLNEEPEINNMELTPQQQQLFISLTPKQQQVFNSLSSYSRNILLRDVSENLSNIKTMLNAIGFYMENPPQKEQDVRYDTYKQYLRTQERKRIFGVTSRNYKT